MTPREISDIFADMELRLIQSLKRHLKVVQSDDLYSWQTRCLRSIEKYRRQNTDIFRTCSPDIEREVTELLQEAFIDGVETVEAEHRIAFPNVKAEGGFSGINSDRLDSLIEDVNENLHMAETSSLRMMEDVYRSVIYKAELAQATGSVTMQQAVDMAVQDFLERGINSIEYADGRRVNIASYAEMALRSASTRSMLRGEAQKRKQLGVDTVLVSQYGACSETCLPWQGRVYIDDVWGDSQDYNVQSGKAQSINGKRYPLLSEAVEAGLFHPNCRHGVSTWYEGISKMPTPLDATVVRHTAELEHRQRELERKVRRFKRLEEGSQDEETVAKYRRKRMAAQKQLREFVRDHEDVLRRDYWREKIHKPESVLQIPILKQDIADQNGAFDFYRAKEQYNLFLQSVPKKNRMYLEYFASNTDYMRTKNQHISFGYSTKKDVIVYNDSHPRFWDFPFEIVNTHELSHRIDHQLVHSERNQAFSDAIIESANRLDTGQVELLLSRHKNVRNDEFFCDILSGILGDHHDALICSHSHDYWKITGNRQKEIFANLFSLECFQRTEALSVIKEEFSSLYEAYILMMEEIVI